jgi:hypothetical protein
MKLRAGDQVVVRSQAEILATLDRDGCCEGLPFMPEMFQFCDKRFTVYKRAHKTCDTVNKTGGRRLVDCVHLDLRCDGEAHGGCQAACLIFWKAVWLLPAPTDEREEHAPGIPALDPVVERSRGCTPEDVLRATRQSVATATESVHYSCQATRLPEFTTLLRWWNPSQYVEDVYSGNYTLRAMLRAFGYFFYRWILRLSPWRVRVLLIQGYDCFQARRGGVPYPRKTGRGPSVQPAPANSLELRPGDLVRVKSYDAILATLDEANKNRGLYFDAEMVPYCGGTYRVRTRVERFLDEKTGAMIKLKRPSFMLEGVWCRSQYSECRLACPRSIFIWWRDIWLEKAEDGAGVFEPIEADRR